MPYLAGQVVAITGVVSPLEYRSVSFDRLRDLFLGRLVGRAAVRLPGWAQRTRSEPFGLFAGQSEHGECAVVDLLE